MKIWKPLLSLGTLGILISGCIDTSSPERTIASLVNAVQKNEPKDVDALLIDEAHEKFSSAEGMEILKAKLAGFKRLNFGEVIITDETSNRRLYRVDLIGKKADKDSPWEKLWGQKLNCTYWVTRDNPTNPHCSPTRPDCRTEPPRYREYENCRIYEIDL